MTTLRKPQNSNDVDSKFERVAGELRAKLRWGVVLPEVSGCKGLLGGRVSGCQGLLGGRVAGCQGLLGARGCWVQGFLSGSG